MGNESHGDKGQNRLNDKIKRAKELLVDARALLSGLDVSRTDNDDTEPMELPGRAISEADDMMKQGSVAVMAGEHLDYDGNPEQNATASSSVTKASAKSARRRKRENI